MEYHPLTGMFLVGMGSGIMLTAVVFGVRDLVRWLMGYRLVRSESDSRCGSPSPSPLQYSISARPLVSSLTRTSAMRLSCAAASLGWPSRAVSDGLEVRIDRRQIHRGWCGQLPWYRGDGRIQFVEVIEKPLRQLGQLRAGNRIGICSIRDISTAALLKYVHRVNRENFQPVRDARETLADFVERLIDGSRLRQAVRDRGERRAGRLRATAAAAATAAATTTTTATADGLPVCLR